MSLFAATSDENSAWSKGSSLFNIASPLNDLLETEDFTLEQILQEDELIQEVKTRNTKLLEFLSQEEVVLKLVEYVICTPEPDSDDLRTLKYPYMSCEVICCDMPSITETLAGAGEGRIVETLFEFLYSPGPLDPRLAGYFEKIMQMLMVRKPQEMTALMNKNSEKLLKAFVSHTQSFSISELFKRLLQPYQNDFMDDMMDFPGMSMGFPASNPWYSGAHDDDDASVGTPTSSSQKTLAWQQDTTVVDLLVANLAPTDAEGKSVDSDVHKHSADVLVDILHCGTRAQQSDPASPTSVTSPVSLALLEYLETKEVVEKVLDLAIPPPETPFVASSMTSALSVLSALLSRHSNVRYSQTEDLPITVSCTLDRLPQLCATLRAEDHDAGTIRNQRQQEVPRLGLRRLKLVGLVVLLIQTKYHKVDAALLQENAIDVLLDLFFKFESVNMLHADVESMVAGILEGGSPDLLKALIKNARLLPRILEAHAKNDEAVKQPRGFSFGFVGHLHRICNVIISLSEDAHGKGRESLTDMAHIDSVVELLEEDEAVWKQWDELAQSVLAPIYERERLPLGGSASGSASEDPYAVMGGFSANAAMLNDKFAEMLSSPAFDPPDDHPFDTDFDIKGDTAMMPEIMHDSSSSSDEEDLAERRQNENDDFDFNPRGNSSKAESSSGWANFDQPSASWANFEQAANSFAASFDASDSSFAAFDVAAPDSPPAVMEFVNEPDVPSIDSSESSPAAEDASPAPAPVPAPTAEAETPPTEDTQ